MSKLNEMIREFREDIGQSVEGLALLMQMEPEEFAQLEEDWIPPEDILQRLCVLFEWNFKDIKRIADKTPSLKPRQNDPEIHESSLKGETSAKINAPPFARMIREARIKAKQDARGIATLLGVSQDYYEELEAGLIPPDDMLRKLCSLFGWNYKKIQQKISRQSTVLYGTRQPPISVSEIQSMLPKVELPEIKDFPTPVSLHEQIQQARIGADQNVEGISLLLQINPEYYEQIENGNVLPDKDLLKRISSLFGWNYQELLHREKSSQYRQLQPAVTSLDTSEFSKTEIKLREIQKKIEGNWREISQEKQETLLTQLEFFSEMMDRWKSDG